MMTEINIEVSFLFKRLSKTVTPTILYFFSLFVCVCASMQVYTRHAICMKIRSNEVAFMIAMLDVF